MSYINFLPPSVVCWWLLQTVWTQIRPDKMSDLILAQSVWHSDGITERIFSKKLILKKSADDRKSMKNFPGGKELKLIDHICCVCWLFAYKYRLLIIFANSLDPYQAWSGSYQFDTLMVFMKEFFEKVIFEKISRCQKRLKNFPGGKEFKLIDHITCVSPLVTADSLPKSIVCW